MEAQFVGMTGSAAFGPSSWFSIADHVLYECPNKRPVAKYESPFWTYAGTAFTTMRFCGPVYCRFDADAESAMSGPYAEVHVRDGSLYADERLLAQYDDRAEAWSIKGRLYPEVHIRPPELKDLRLAAQK